MCGRSRRLPPAPHQVAGLLPQLQTVSLDPWRDLWFVPAHLGGEWQPRSIPVLQATPPPRHWLGAPPALPHSPMDRIPAARNPAPGPPVLGRIPRQGIHRWDRVQRSQNSGWAAAAPWPQVLGQRDVSARWLGPIAAGFVRNKNEMAAIERAVCPGRAVGPAAVCAADAAMGCAAQPG